MNFPRAVLLGALVDGSASASPASAAQDLERTLDVLNVRFASSLESPLSLFRGTDGVCAVLHRATDAFDIAVRMNLALHPVQFAFAVVELRSPNEDAASLLPGPFHVHAAEAFLESMVHAGLRFVVSGTRLGEPFGTVLSELGNLHLQLIAEMKPRTIAALAAFYDRHPVEPLPSQAEVARRLGLKTRQAVSDALSRGRFETLGRIEAAIRRGLTAW